MSTLYWLTFLLGLWATGTPVDNVDIQNVDIQFIDNDDLQVLLEKHKNAQLLEPHFTINQNKGRTTITRQYRLGERINGDLRVVHKMHNYVFGTPQNISIKANYPSASSNNQAATVSLVDILVSQSSNLGNAYILNGGIGQQNIEFVIVANNTELIKYDISIYGYY